MTGQEPPVALVLTGPPGTGKTTTMWALHELLTELEVPNAIVDVDQVRTAWPAPADDLFNERLSSRNVQAIAETYRQHGVRWLVLADVIEGDAWIANYRTTLPAWQLTIVRLRVDRERLIARLHERESPESLA